MRSGIYKILNVTTGKFYIGSSKNIDTRFTQHRNKLNKNKHYNTYLQNAWNKYGEESFKFEIVEEVTFHSRKQLKDLEQSYLDNIDKPTTYNICKYADGGETGPALIGYKHPRHRKISVYDINMNFIEEISGLREAERKYNTKCVYKCCMGKISNAVNFIFKYSDDFKPYIRKHAKYHPKNPIVCLDSNGEFLCEYDSVLSASRQLNVSREYIDRRLQNREPRIKKYFFKYKYQKDVV
jgi:group I intron endonuclease